LYFAVLVTFLIAVALCEYGHKNTIKKAYNEEVCRGDHLYYKGLGIKLTDYGAPIRCDGTTTDLEETK